MMRSIFNASSPVLSSSLVALLLGGCPEKLPEKGKWTKVEDAPASRSLFTEEQKQKAVDAKTRAHIRKMREAFVKAEERSCKVDDDCVLTPYHCCECGANGQKDAVHKEQLPEVIKRRGPVCSEMSCAQVVSTHASCNATGAVCRSGQCVPDVPGGAAPAPSGVGVEKIPDDDAPSGEAAPKAEEPATK
jgi:hypothetical protein